MNALWSPGAIEGCVVVAMLQVEKMAVKFETGQPGLKDDRFVEVWMIQ
jgi:hypothetical protein